MATYIPQVQDKIEKVNPPQTNWQFEAQSGQAMQSKYDQGHKKLSDMYGYILNSGLTREENLQAREQFFKTIDNDLRKVAGMDLSLDSNVSKAKNVFSQIYENDFLVKDMVWTKQFQGEMQRANSFRNCLDVTKCGGEFWEDGVKAMTYKREEYKSMSNEESLGAQKVRYVPYNNIMEKALKIAKDANLNISLDTVSADGNFIITTKNGKNLISPMTTLLSSLLKDNPELQDMYKVKSYNDRKDWTYQAVQMGKYEDLDAAAAGYVQERAKGIIERGNRIATAVDMDVSVMETRINSLRRDFENGIYDATNVKKLNELAVLEELLPDALEAKSYTDLVKNAEKNMYNQTNMNVIGDILDGVMATEYFNKDLLVTAETLSHQNEEVTMDENQFALNEQKHRFNILEETNRQKNRESLEYLKAYYKREEEKGGRNLKAINAAGDVVKKKEAYEAFNISAKLGQHLAENTAAYNVDGLEAFDEYAVRKFFTDNPNAIGHNEILNKLDEFVAAKRAKAFDLNAAVIKTIDMGNDVNSSSIIWEVFTPDVWKSLKKNLSDEQKAQLDIPKGILAIDETPKGLPIYKIPDILTYNEDGTVATVDPRHTEYIFENNVWKEEIADDTFKIVPKGEKLDNIKANHEIFR